jgi:acetyl-CoA acetyltransferase
MEDRTPCIVGIGLSDYPKVPELTERQHEILAMQRALEDCGIKKSDIDGYCSPDPILSAEYLGIDYRFLSGTGVGGSMYEFFCQHSAAAIRSGMCDTVLITYGSSELSSKGRSLGTGFMVGAGGAMPPMYSYEASYGTTIVSQYALAARRHMHEYGTTSEQLAEIAVAMRYHAGMNPNALYRDPITVDDVLNSRMIADPLHLLDCCVISDGGGAVIMTTADRAKDLKKRPIKVLGASTAQTHWSNITQMPELTSTAIARCAPEAFGQAGVQPGDVDTLQTYDSYTITALLAIEGLGFCKSGEGGAFVEGGTLKLGGALPTNTDGGGLSACHPGMRGIFLLIEATRQLRGEGGVAQVEDCEVGVACGVGGWLSGTGVIVLGKG